uniref:Uncharacterized protein n=1 Tax=Oncorhynchus tshawytscha TaxID=74940 RepID=A0A8C8FVT4_ONCTS
MLQTILPLLFNKRTACQHKLYPIQTNTALQRQNTVTTLLIKIDKTKGKPGDLKIIFEFRKIVGNREKWKELVPPVATIQHSKDENITT